MRARVVAGGLAAAGVGASHWLAYRLIVPDAHARHEMLEHTGHRYFNALAAVALGVFVASLAGFVVSRCRREGGQRSASFLALAQRLFVLQAAGWLVLEGAERLVVAHHHSSMFGEPVVWAGLALQIVVAALSALLFVALDRAITVILTLTRRFPPVPRRRIAWAAHDPEWSSGTRHARGWSSRGPPSYRLA
jgi:hypothetical protein